MKKWYWNFQTIVTQTLKHLWSSYHIVSPRVHCAKLCFYTKKFYMKDLNPLEQAYIFFGEMDGVAANDFDTNIQCKGHMLIQ